MERTCSIIKPDAVAKNVIGEIYARFEKVGLRVVAAKMMQLSQAQAEGFYEVSSDIKRSAIWSIRFNKSAPSVLS